MTRTATFPGLQKAGVYMTPDVCNVQTSGVYMTPDVCNVQTSGVYTTLDVCNVQTSGVYTTLDVCNVQTSGVYTTLVICNVQTSGVYTTPDVCNVQTSGVYTTPGICNVRRRGVHLTRAVRAVAMAVALCCASALSAQAPAPRMGDLDYLSRSDAWLGSENAAGLQALPAVRLSTVEAYLHRGIGGFVNYYESDNSTEAGAATESYYRLNPHIVFYGQVHYGNFTGRSMGGSAWIDPYGKPFNLVETADTTGGTKLREQYRLSGALGIHVWRGLSLGGRIDYQATNYAKTRDLRHVNKFSDLAFSLGARWAFSSLLELGVNGFYRHSVEEVEFGLYGNTDRLYSSLIDFGAFFGRTELFVSSGNGYASGSDSKPLFDAWQGLGVQAALRPGGRWRLFVEATGKRRSGEYGTRGTASVVYTEHTGTAYTLAGTLEYRRDSTQHLLAVVCRQEQLTNGENVFEENNTTGNRSEIIYYGKNTVRDAHRRAASLTYMGYFGLSAYRPAWRIAAGADYAQLRQTVNQFPFYRKQYIYRYTLFLDAGREVSRRANDFGLLLGATYGQGGGAPKDDGVYAPPSETQKPPKEFDAYLYHEFDYLTVPRVAARVEGSYARRFARLRAAVSLRYERTQALSAVRIFGNTFHFVSLSLSCTF